MYQHFIKDFGKTALIHGDQSVTYHQLLQHIHRFATQLDLQPGEHVVLYGENSLSWVYALYAVWSKGGVAVPCDFAAPAEELAYMLHDAQPSLLLTSETGRANLEADPVRAALPQRVLVLEDLNQTGPLPNQSPERSLDDTALILYTSGTTGFPKGVMLSFNSLLFNIQAVIASGMLQKDDRLMALFPFHHIVPLQGHILCPLYIGATVAFVTTPSAEEIMNTFQQHKISVINGVPRLYERFHQTIFNKLKANPLGRILLLLGRILPFRPVRRFLFARVHKVFGGRVRFLLSGGAALDKKIADEFWLLGFRMIEGYGMTEMGPLISYNMPKAWKTGTVGRPVPGVEVMIKDGEVVAKSPGAMQGYFNKPDETGEVLVDGWVHSGDLGHFDRQGFLVLEGRKNDMLVLPSGKNIHTAAIENRLLATNPLLAEVALTQRNGKLFAFIHPDFEALKERGIKNVREAMKWDVLDEYNQSAPSYKRILDFTVVDKPFPRTRLGKIRRYQLEKLLHAPKSESAQKQARETEVLKTLQTYLSAETGSRVQPASHLEMDLGLDSLALIDLKIYIENTFGFTSNETLFIEHPTVSELAAYVEAHKTRIDTNHSGIALLLQNIRPQKIKRSRSAFYLLWFLFAPLLRLFYRVKREGFNQVFQLVQQGKNFIMAPNHQSYLDPLMLSRALPVRVLRDTYFLAKAKHFRIPFGRFFRNNLNTILLDINQESEKIIKKMVDLLQQGKNVVIFPEGTRSYSGKLGRFSKTFAVLSKELKIPVLPVGIKGTYELLPRDRRIPRPGVVQIKIFPSIEPGEQDATQISQSVFTKLKAYIEGEV